MLTFYPKILTFDLKILTFNLIIWNEKVQKRSQNCGFKSQNCDIKRQLMFFFSIFHYYATVTNFGLHGQALFWVIFVQF